MIEFDPMNQVVRSLQILPFLGWFACANHALAMDRFAALAMIESGNDDFAHGRNTEVSRYQIRREVWLQVTNTPIELATNSTAALAVARVIADKRCQEFEKKRGRAPTDFEFYVLWNSPRQVDDPSPAVRARARRFVNLVERKE
jgi:uncharacterized protein YbaA (DUF1428 family)